MKSDEIARLFPSIFRRTLVEGSPFAALLGVMESLHQPSERVLATFPTTLDPMSTSDAFVPFLASWVGLEPILEPTASRTGISPGLGRLRLLVAQAAQLAKWRGTAKGLLAFLELATGVSGFEIVESAPFHFELHVPAAAEPHRELIERIVALEKPAYVTCTISFPTT